MKIIPLVLVMGTAPLLPLMAQENAAAKPQAEATPAKTGRSAKAKAKATPAPKAEEAPAAPKKAEAGKAEPRRFKRVSRRNERPARPVVTEEVAQKGSQTAAAEVKPDDKKAQKSQKPQKENAKPQAAASPTPEAKNARNAKAAKKAEAKATPASQTAGRPVRGRATAEKAKPAPKPEVEMIEDEPKKKGGPFSFLGKIFGGGRKDKAEGSETTEEATAQVGPPAPTPVPRSSRGGQSSAARHQMAAATEEVDDEASLPSYQRQQQHQGPPVAVHRTLSNEQGEMVNIDDDLPSSGPRGGHSAQPAMQPSSAPGYLEPVFNNRQPAAASPQQQVAPAASVPVTAPPATFDRTRYQEVRRTAASDPAVAALGQKLNATTASDAGHAGAARAYTSALFDKMRELDPEQIDWINRMEGATLRRIDAGKPVFAE